jgi:P2-related tail formation protein
MDWKPEKKKRATFRQTVHLEKTLSELAAIREVVLREGPD